MKEYQVIGKPVPLIASREKATGKAKYTDDIRLNGALHIKILRSPHACADIRGIDAAGALKAPGVRAVITGRDFNHTFGVLPISKDEPAIARDTVRYVGEPVAAVAADTEAQAEEAARRIRVEYEVLDPCLDPRAALLDTDRPIHPELGRRNNLHKSARQEFGDPAKGFGEAAVVVEGTFDFQPLTHGFTEPHATQVEIDAQGSITVYSSTQVPHYLHRALAEVLEIPMHRIRVIKPHLGGGFGGKSDPFPHEMIAAKLALITGRNTRLSLTREEVFSSNHGRHPTTINMKLGLHPEKGITALGTDVLIDGGSYGSFGVVTTYYNGVLLHGPYPAPNFSFACDRVYTNKPMCGAMRGHGGVNPRFAGEVLFDMACAKAGLDPCEARMKFIHEPNTVTANGFRITSVGLKEGLRKAMERSAWKDKFGKLPYGKGIGVACGFFISGSALPIHWNKMPQSTVRLTIDFDGGVTVYSGASDIGQGSDTMLAQNVAEVLGVPISVIRVIAADTRLCPIDLGSYSSRVTFMAGNAARNAAIRMRRILVAAACDLLEIGEPRYGKPDAPDSFFRQGGRKPDFDDPYLGPNPDYSDGFEARDLAFTPLTGSREGTGVPYLDAVRKAMDGHGALQTQGIYVSPKMGGDFKGAGAGLSPGYSFTAFISEVTVDPGTGFVRVDKVTGAHDCGFPLNPLSVEGQLDGSIHMGLGQALMEGIRYDPKLGVVQNASFLEYKMLSPFEQPEIDVAYDADADNEGPFGAKEVGEGALAPIIPSVANAIHDAVGVRLRSVPMTPDRVLAAIEAGAAVTPRAVNRKGGI
jgi:CO/xanthine dehydrogenase Mo-binding subunit